MPLVSVEDILVDAALIGYVADILVVPEQLRDLRLYRIRIVLRLPVSVVVYTPRQALHQLDARICESHLRPPYNSIKVAPQVFAALVVLMRRHVVFYITSVAICDPSKHRFEYLLPYRGAVHVFFRPLDRRASRLGKVLLRLVEPRSCVDRIPPLLRRQLLARRVYDVEPIKFLALRSLADVYDKLIAENRLAFLRREIADGLVIN